MTIRELFKCSWIENGIYFKIIMHHVMGNNYILTLIQHIITKLNYSWSFKLYISRKSQREEDRWTQIVRR